MPTRHAPTALPCNSDANLFPAPYEPDAHLSPAPYKPDAHLSPAPYKPDAHLFPAAREWREDPARGQET